MPLPVGAKAPDFELLNEDLKPVRLSEVAKTGRPVVLLFFPGAFTSVCTKELCTFRDKMALLNKANAEVLAISVDSPFALKAFKEANRLNFPLLSDYNRIVIGMYDVVQSNLLGLPLYHLAKRAVYIIKNGEIKYVWHSDDPRDEPPYDEVIKKSGTNLNPHHIQIPNGDHAIFPRQRQQPRDTPDAEGQHPNTYKLQNTTERLKETDPIYIAPPTDTCTTRRSA